MLIQIFFPVVLRPIFGSLPPIIEASRSHSRTRAHTVGLLWTSNRPVAEISTWHHTTLTTNNYAPGGIRTHNTSKGAAADPRLMSRGHFDRTYIHIYPHFSRIVTIHSTENVSKSTHVWYLPRKIETRGIHQLAWHCGNLFSARHIID